MAPPRVRGRRCAGDKLKDALSELGTWTFEIIKRSDTAKGFKLLPRRRVAENIVRMWFNRCRRIAKNFEATIKKALAWDLIVNIAWPDDRKDMKESTDLPVAQRHLGRHHDFRPPDADRARRAWPS